MTISPFDWAFADATFDRRNKVGRSFCTASRAFCTLALEISSAVIRFGLVRGIPLAAAVPDEHAAVLAMPPTVASTTTVAASRWNEPFTQRPIGARGRRRL